MTDYNFRAQKREEGAKNARSKGIIPAVIYGKDFENQKLSLNKNDFNKIFREAGTSNLINLELDNGSPIKVLVHEVQKHPVNGEIQHIDLYKVNMKEKITTEIPLEFIGTSPLVIEEDGSQIVNHHEIEVECLPTDLIDHIEVDVSKITDFEQNIKISDLSIPENIEVKNEPEEVVVFIQPPRSEEELEALDEDVVEDVESVEIEEKGKEEEEGTEEGKGGKTDEEKDKTQAEDESENKE